MLVFGLGGGTIGVSVVEVQPKAICVLATDGDTHLGGRDFDKALLGLVLDRWEEEWGDGVAAALKEEAKKGANEEKDKRKHHSSTNTLAWRVGREALVQNLQRSA